MGPCHTALYIEVGAGGSEYEVRLNRAPYRNLNPNPDQRGAQPVTGSHQPRRPTPPTSTTSSPSSPNVAAHAQTSPTNEMAASGPSPSTVSSSTRSSSIPLSLYPRYRIHSKENPLDPTLDDLFDLHNGIRASLGIDLAYQNPLSRCRSCQG